MPRFSVSVVLGCNSIGYSYGMLFSESYGEYDVDIVAVRDHFSGEKQDCILKHFC